MKPIPFNTDMVRAILDGRKTVTRRVVKKSTLERFVIDDNGELVGSLFPNDQECIVYPSVDDCPYQPEQILYVRETWNYGYCDKTDFEFQYNETFFEELKPGSMNGSFLFPHYFYRAEDLDGIVGMRWRPSIHMPREAARIFLRVTDVRVERLQDITDGGIFAEGILSKKKGWELIDFADFWNSTIKPADLALYGWEANPYVWVIMFERISKEDATQ